MVLLMMFLLAGCASAVGIREHVHMVDSGIESEMWRKGGIAGHVTPLPPLPRLRAPKAQAGAQDGGPNQMEKARDLLLDQPFEMVQLQAQKADPLKDAMDSAAEEARNAARQLQRTERAAKIHHREKTAVQEKLKSMQDKASMFKTALAAASKKNQQVLSDAAQAERDAQIGSHSASSLKVARDKARSESEDLKHQVEVDRKRLRSAQKVAAKFVKQTAHIAQQRVGEADVVATKILEKAQLKAQELRLLARKSAAAHVKAAQLKAQELQEDARSDLVSTERREIESSRKNKALQQDFELAESKVWKAMERSGDLLRTKKQADQDVSQAKLAVKKEIEEEKHFATLNSALLA